jgi:hypothetical protein
MTRRTLARIAIIAFVVVVLAFFVLAVVNAWHATNGQFPSLGRLTAAGLLWGAGLLAAAYGWTTLLGTEHRLVHAAAYLVAQLGKYAPGGVVQATSQVGLARSAGVPVSRGVTALTVLSITQVAGGATWAIVLAVAWTDTGMIVRVLIAAGAIASLALVDRRWMVWALRRIPRTRDASDSLVPAQPAILRAYASGVFLVGAVSVAYLLMLASFGRVDNPWLVIGAYAVAWTIGFAAVPIPAGFGLREAVLIGILHGMFPASVIVAASVFLRIAQLIVEGILAAISSHRVRPSRLREIT